MSAGVRKFEAPSECPVCGADVPKGALACPNCGADERTGWNEDLTQYDGMDLPDTAFESDGHSTRSVHRRAATTTGIPYFTWIAAVILLALVVTLVIYRVF